MNYVDFQSQLDFLDVESTPGEVHGQLCGLLCTCPEEKAKARWFASVLENFQSQPGLLTESPEQSRAALQELDGMFKSTAAQLQSADFTFEIFVDADTDGQLAAERMQALAQWCGGFVYGFGLGVGEQSTPLPEDTKELIGDFLELSRYQLEDENDAAEQDRAVVLSISEQDESDENEAEADLTEIEEFVRVGVLLINEEMQQASAPVSNASTGVATEAAKAAEDGTPFPNIPPTLH